MIYPTVWRSRTLPVWNEFDRLLDRPLMDGGSKTWMPVVDVRETRDHLVFHAELPGLKRDDIAVNVENNVLTISGEKSTTWGEEAETSQFHVLERRYGSFARSFRLPKSVDTNRIDARFTDGVLSVTVPKVEAAKPLQIQVKVK